LSDQFKAKVARGDAKWVSSGFVGKGFTFEADEMNEGQKAASLQRRAYEIEQGIQEEREEEEDLLDEELFDEGDAVVMPPVESGAAAVAADAMAAAGPEAVKTAVSTKAITVEPFPPVPAGIVDTQAALARAKQLAAQMVSKSAPPVAEARGPGHFADELEINDYPAAARKKVTHRSVMDDIAERTGVNVISRGVFIEPGKTPKLGERKLFLLLEGTTEMQVRQAKLEVIRQLEEETLKLGAGIAAGRYSVV
jgi:ATP-dependent RNA helicase DDX46/PRP5